MRFAITVYNSMKMPPNLGGIFFSGQKGRRDVQKILIFVTHEKRVVYVYNIFKNYSWGDPSA